MTNYAPLHCHTTYSTGDAFGTPQQLAEAMAEAGCVGGAVTEHGNAYSWVKWKKACKAAGIKAVFGVEHYITQDRSCRDVPPGRAKDPEGFRRHHNRRYHVTTLALDAQGWADQMMLLNYAHRRGTEDKPGGYWYKPRIDWRLLSKFGEHLIVTSGCMSSFSSQRVLEGDLKKAEAYCKRMARLFGDRWYLEIMPNNFEGQEVINTFCFIMHMRHGWPLVVTNDVHYPKAGDWRKRTFLLKQNGMNNYDPVGTCYVLTADDIIAMGRKLNGKDSVKFWRQGIDNSNAILERVHDPEKVVPSAPGVAYPVPKRFEQTEEPGLAFLKHLCKEGWERRDLPTTPKYVRRLKRELRILSEKNFVDQILLVWGIIDFCRRNGILVGTRGSAAGSLVCYLIGITDLDPLEFDLLFERFVDITRNDPPDIDMDIQHNRRAEVKAYLRDLYGRASVGDICTFAQYRSRSALQALAAEHDVPAAEVSIITNLLVDKDNDLVGSLEKNQSLLLPTVERHPSAKRVWDKYPGLHMAADLDGMVKHTSKHAGGVIIATGGTDLRRVCFFNQDNVWGLDKKDAEGLGFLKVDALGLITMSCLADARDAIKELHDVDVDFHALRLDDQETIEGFRTCDLQGIFQFEGRTARLITFRVAPCNFDEIVDINALCRPGPMYGGATEEYVKAGHGGFAENWPHPVLDRITAKTRGTILYQEQMLQIMREAGGMGWDDVTHARRAISKRLGLQEMDKLRAKFVKGAKKKNGIGADDANWIWDRMVTFGTYAFNKSHAAAYSRVGYWCMWVKRHYPDIFYTVFSRHVSNEHKQRRLLVEYMMRGGVVLPPDVNESGLSFSLERDGIRPGLADIKFIGTKCAQEIIANRPYDPPESILEKLPRRIVNKRVREALVNLGALPGAPSMDPAEAPAFYYSWYMPEGIEQFRLPSYATAADCAEMRNMEHATIVGRVATRWNNTYQDEKHRVEGSAATAQYGEHTGRVVTYKIELEDETGEVFVAFRKHYERNRSTLKEIRPGDIILVEGVWVKDYERISGREVQLLRAKSEQKPKVYVPDELFS